MMANEHPPFTDTFVMLLIFENFLYLLTLLLVANILDRCYKHRGGKPDRDYICLYIACNQCVFDLHEVPLLKCEGDDKGLQALFIFLHYFLFFHVCHVLFMVQVSLPSLHWHLNTHSLYTRCIKRWITCQSYFIILTVRTRDVRNHDRLEWLLNCILSFSRSGPYTRHTKLHMTDYRQCGACSGSPQ